MSFIVKLLVWISPWDFLVTSITEMGWEISVKKGRVQGLVIGTEEYVNGILDAKDKLEKLVRSLKKCKGELVSLNGQPFVATFEMPADDWLALLKEIE